MLFFRKEWHPIRSPLWEKSNKWDPFNPFFGEKMNDSPKKITGGTELSKVMC